MPYGEPDHTDPMILSGVVFEDAGAPTEAAVREMAECFIEEYARLGFDANRILHMFQVRGYAGPYMATQMLGEAAVRELVDQVIARWGGRRDGALAKAKEEKGWSLTVLD